MVHNYRITELEREISTGIINRISFIVDSLHEEVGERYNGEIEVTGSIDTPGFIEFENLTQEKIDRKLQHEKITKDNSYLWNASYFAAVVYIMNKNNMYTPNKQSN